MPLADIRARIAAAVAAAGRPAHAVTLVAVSKVQPAERVRAVLAEGQRIFGENRVQEAEGRWPPFQAEFAGVELHLVGPLQSNKLARALDLFQAIHSLDRDRLARRLADAVQARGACPTLFVEVNVGREPQKAGIFPDALDAFVATCRDSYGLPVFGLMAIPPADEDPAPHFAALAVNNIKKKNFKIGKSPTSNITVKGRHRPERSTPSSPPAATATGSPVFGLMAIPPADEDPAPHFAALAAMAARNGLPGLSMGMSADFEPAIAAGATHVRIGSSIFGERAAAAG